MTRQYLITINEINWPTKPVKVSGDELRKAFSEPSEFNALLNTVMERALMEKQKLSSCFGLQLSFAENGNITPCPYTNKCLNYPAGCSGHSFWCDRKVSDLERGKYKRRTTKCTN